MDFYKLASGKYVIVDADTYETLRIFEAHLLINSGVNPQLLTRTLPASDLWFFDRGTSKDMPDGFYILQDETAIRVLGGTITSPKTQKSLEVYTHIQKNGWGLKVLRGSPAWRKLSEAFEITARDGVWLDGVPHIVMTDDNNEICDFRRRYY
jgi:hypothetical protein